MRLQDTFIDSIFHFQSAVTDFASSHGMDLSFLLNQADVTDKVIEVTAEHSELSPLGNDLLIFLCATIGIVPLFKVLKASSVIGFLAAGALMGPAGLKLFTDLNDLEILADCGVLFLLFEQGLELTVDRLQKLSKYAFGMGTLQILLSTIAFFVFPFVGGVQFLEYFIHSRPELVDITRVDEAVVIGAALSLSSSAFVLKILQEKGQLKSQFGAACLGVLLMQDIAVVPLLAFLPIIESSTGEVLSVQAQLTILGGTLVKALLGLGGILIIGRTVVRFLFSLVAQSKSSETFIALCLLVALGTGVLTDSLGLSSTLGSFTAGTLLASSNYRTQIESDIKPFRGLLLGLFFITTGATVDFNIIRDEWPTVLALLVGLLSFKAAITTGLAKIFGLSTGDSVRTGLILSGGGEFAFVVLNLADKLEVIPGKLAKILVGLVVISMALTPLLSSLGDRAANYLEAGDTKLLKRNDDDDTETKEGEEYIVVCGYGPVGQSIMKIVTFASQSQQLFYENEKLNRPPQDENSVIELKKKSFLRCKAFDLDPNLVIKGYRDGYDILYGDGSQPLVLSTAGIDAKKTKAFVVTYNEGDACVKAVMKIRSAFPTTPIISRSVFRSSMLSLTEV